MANTPILGLPLLSANQSNKETTINDAFSYLEKATNGAKTLDVSQGDVSLSLLDIQRFFILKPVGATAPVTISIPATSKIFAIDNSDGTFPVTISRGTTSLGVPVGTTRVMFVNDADLVFLYGSAGGGGGGGIPEAPLDGKVYGRKDGDWVEAAATGNTGPSPTSNRWRLSLPDAVADANVALAKVEFRATIGGPDQAVGGTASSYSDGYNTSPAYAFDSSINTYWIGPAVANQWLMYEFTSPVKVEEVLLTSINDSTYGVPCSPTMFSVQYFDGTSWVTYWEVTNPGFTAPAQSIAFANPDAPTETFTDAPTDGYLYARQSGEWKKSAIALNGFFASTMANNELLYNFIVPTKLKLPASLTGSVATAVTGPAGATTIILRKNGTNIGTINFATGATTATFTFAAEVTFVDGDTISFHAPTTADASLANVSFSLKFA